MTIEMDDRNRSISLVDTPQQGQGDGMIATHGDDAGESLARSRETVLISVGEGLPHEEIVVAMFDLLDGPVIVIPDHSLAFVHFNSRRNFGDHTKSRGYHHNPRYEDH